MMQPTVNAAATATDIGKVLLSKEQISERVKQLGEQITTDYAGRNLLVVGVLNGSAIFVADLIREINLPLVLDFMRVSSMEGTHSTGNITMKLDVGHKDLSNFDVIIVEDIVETGLTIDFIKKHLASRNPRSIKICSLLAKPKKYKYADVAPEYLGFTMGDEFIIGYGLDLDGLYRNLPYIADLK